MCVKGFRHEPPVMIDDVVILHQEPDVVTVCKPASVPVSILLDNFHFMWSLDLCSLLDYVKHVLFRMIELDSMPKESAYLPVSTI